MDGRQMDKRKNNVALAHPNHKGKWCSKFGWIPPSGLGGYSMTDRLTDARKNNIALAHPYYEE